MKEFSTWEHGTSIIHRVDGGDHCNLTNGMKISLRDEEGNERIFDSQCQAARAIGVNPATISESLKYGRKGLNYTIGKV